MTALRVLATLALFTIGWLFRRRPLLGPLVLMLVGTGIYRLWHDTRGSVAVGRAYHAPTAGRSYPAVPASATSASHRW